MHYLFILCALRSVRGALLKSENIQELKESQAHQNEEDIQRTSLTEETNDIYSLPKSYLEARETLCSIESYLQMRKQKYLFIWNQIQSFENPKYEDLAEKVFEDMISNARRKFENMTVVTDKGFEKKINDAGEVFENAIMNLSKVFKKKISYPNRKSYKMILEAGQDFLKSTSNAARAFQKTVYSANLEFDSLLKKRLELENHYLNGFSQILNKIFTQIEKFVEQNLEKQDQLTSKQSDTIKYIEKQIRKVNHIPENTPLFPISSQNEDTSEDINFSLLNDKFPSDYTLYLALERVIFDFDRFRLFKNVEKTYLTGLDAEIFLLIDEILLKFQNRGIIDSITDTRSVMKHLCMILCDLEMSFDCFKILYLHIDTKIIDFENSTSESDYVNDLSTEINAKNEIKDVDNASNEVNSEDERKDINEISSKVISPSSLDLYEPIQELIEPLALKEDINIEPNPYHLSNQVNQKTYNDSKIFKLEAIKYIISVMESSKNNYNHIIQEFLDILISYLQSIKTEEDYLKEQARAKFASFKEKIADESFDEKNNLQEQKKDIITESSLDQSELSD